ncbi:flagellar hook-associated protein 1 FlgK [Pseudobutyrivibrio sp. OR37]|uniref:flagellar hook-associated protein FlgK n=1 Tax=Pseudobutyrivibrio sp. OR37 TaxID=1798186 RepID=UPI0008E1195D|nr:flagellar hook-associated protein FlgK [Pseudobutyrivibrio sp. OR37]SFH74665.1 flagellar hook-associated protein 1 FlgK [Pseudobutyrivibrio sp. OR37]
MSSTFFGLTIASSGLNTSQAQINTTANNISNVNTNGYSRQVVNTVASSALRVYQSYGTTGMGVEAESVTQRRDLYYDEKYWNNQSALGYYEKKQYYMNQIEDYYNENTSNTGFTTIYTKMFNAMSTMQGSPGDDTVRKQFISNAKQLTEYFNQLSTKLKDLQNSINDEIKTAVDNINAIAEKVAILNKQINVIEQGGGHANELRDQRALLIDELSEICDVSTKETDVLNSNDPDTKTGATYFMVYINGQQLVDTYEYNTLAVKSRATEQMYNQSDIDGLYDIIWAKDGDRFNPVPSSSGGQLKSMYEVRDGNNNENMHGIVSEATTTTITIKDLTITDLNEFNMPDKGQISTNNKLFTYDGFSFTTNSKGKVESVTFNLIDPIREDIAKGLVDKTFQIGDDVDYMGIPYYQNQMNLFLRNFCERFNKIEESGVDLNGDDMGAFFIAKNLVDSHIEYQMVDPLTVEDPADPDSKIGVTLNSDSKTYYLLTADTVSIAKKTDKDARIFATTTKENYSSGVDAADLIVELQKLQRKETLFRGGGGDAFLQCIYADVTIDAQECKIFSTNFTNIKKTITEQRMSVSGVDEDDEALDLMKFQNAYNLASKCISVFSEIYDRLILNTGV